MTRNRSHWLRGALSCSLVCMVGVAVAAPPTAPPGRSAAQAGRDRATAARSALERERTTPTQAQDRGTGRSRAETIRNELRQERSGRAPANGRALGQSKAEARRGGLDPRTIRDSRSQADRGRGVLGFLRERFGRDRRDIAQERARRLPEQFGNRERSERELPNGRRIMQRPEDIVLNADASDDDATDGSGDSVAGEDGGIVRTGLFPPDASPLARAERQYAKRLAQIAKMRDRAIEAEDEHLLDVADQLEAIAARQYEKRTGLLPEMPQDPMPEPPTSEPPTSEPLGDLGGHSETPIGDEPPLAEDPTAEPPVLEQPVTEEPVVTDPGTGQEPTVGDDPVVPEPVTGVPTEPGV